MRRSLVALALALAAPLRCAGGGPGRQLHAARRERHAGDVRRAALAERSLLRSGTTGRRRRHAARTAARRSASAPTSSRMNTGVDRAGARPDGRLRHDDRDLLLLLGSRSTRPRLPASPRTAPTLADSVFCADAATGAPVPIGLKWNVDTLIPNVLGRPAAARASRSTRRPRTRASSPTRSPMRARSRRRRRPTGRACVTGPAPTATRTRSSIPS